MPFKKVQSGKTRTVFEAEPTSNIQKAFLMLVPIVTEFDPQGSQKGRDLNLLYTSRFAMSSVVSMRSYFDGAILRRLARQARDADQARRLLVHASIYDGGSRGAARLGRVTVQIVAVRWCVSMIMVPRA